MRRAIIPCMVVLTLLSGCGKKPDYVLGKKQMTDLLTDIYKAESLIEIDRSKYATDSMKKTLRQSVYKMHGVTDEQVDSSYMWYGRRLNEYIEIQNDVIDRLENEITEAGGRTAVFAEGDSVNVWDREARFRLTKNDVTGLIGFEVVADENSQNGDNFQLKLKILSPTTSLTEIDGLMGVEYDDGLIELRTARLLEKGGWCKIRIVADTARTYTRVFGHINASAEDGEVIFVDSLSLVRTRFQSDWWSQRSGQRKFRQKINE